MASSARKLLTLSGACALLLAAGTARAQDRCQLDSDCPAGQSCVMAPCAAPACDPDDDPNCDPMPCVPEGTCQDDGSCQTDADCPTGFTCQAMGAETCASPPPCLPGEACPEPEPCETKTFYGCAPGPCQADSDCGGGLVCVSFKEEMCTATASACAPGVDCTDPPPTDPSCEVNVYNFCAPPYIAPCTQDSDCGEGFSCKPEQLCSCSGGGATPVDPSAPDAGGSSESECACQPTGQNYCEAEQRVCTTSTECPDGWSCESYGDVAVPCTFDPQTGVSECMPPEPTELYCVPPDWQVWGTQGGSYDDAVERATNGVAPSDPPTVQDSGCAVSAGQGGAGSVMLLLLGLVVALRRRKSR